MKKINVLFECNSCRDYAFAKSFSMSPILNKLYIMGDNKFARGFGLYVEKKGLKYLQFIKEKNIDLFISFNDKQVLENLIDYNRFYLKIPSIGSTKKSFFLEASKYEAKDFMNKYGILTPKYILLHSVSDLNKALKIFKFPFVLKSNTLSAGFGVHIVNNEKEAEYILNRLAERAAYEHEFLKFDYHFDNNIKVVAEEYINGEEITLQSVWDGKKLKTFLPIKDYKRALDNDLGQNTGGMGGYIPVNIDYKKQKLVQKYLKKLECALKKSKQNFTGFISSNLMFSGNKLYNLEFNMRPGDTEGQLLSEHLKTDFLSILYATATGNLDKINFEYKEGVTACVVIANDAYLNKKYLLNDEIKQTKLSKLNLSTVSQDVELFFSCYLEEGSNNVLQTSVPDRIMNICFTSKQPFKKIYDEINKIECVNVHFRTDIGK
ncbi:MAG: ATP-grasp domain-containing protein [Candidatus Gastranaerophilales bacterium]|nr:ATP-grasp domain-containing protein [Candidatus Gastranaerophilales bacterium]